MAKRYSITSSVVKYASEDGDYVTYSDHIAEVNALKARIAELESEKKSRYPWHEAPEGAMWAATDEDGQKWYYRIRPVPGDTKWNNGIAISSIPFKDWHETLEKRPGT